MIKVTRLNRTKFYLNPFLIETMEETPDTIISITTGKKYIVKESAEEVNLLIKEYLNDIQMLKALNISRPGGQDV